uniref:Uncharacterized protein n=1 Tax=Apis cerana TaxID=7461 RepID=V9I8V4_APICE
MCIFSFSVRETHQIAEAQQEKNAKLREAFGISEFFVEGSSLDPERHAREAEARAAASKVYELVRTPSPAPDTTSAPEKKKRKRSASAIKKKRERSTRRKGKRQRNGARVNEGWIRFNLIANKWRRQCKHR